MCSANRTIKRKRSARVRSLHSSLFDLLSARVNFVCLHTRRAGTTDDVRSVKEGERKGGGLLKKGRSVRVRSLHCCSVTVVFLRRAGELRLHMRRRVERRPVEKGAFLSRSLDALFLSSSDFAEKKHDSDELSPLLL